MEGYLKTEDVVNMLRELQLETANCMGFFAGHVTQTWVIGKLGEKITEIGGKPYVVKENRVYDTKQ